MLSIWGIDKDSQLKGVSQAAKPHQEDPVCYSRKMNLFISQGKAGASGASPIYTLVQRVMAHVPHLIAS